MFWIQVYDKPTYRGYYYFWFSGTFSSIVSDGNSLEITLASAFDNEFNKFNASWTTGLAVIYHKINSDIYMRVLVTSAYVSVNYL